MKTVFIEEFNCLGKALDLTVEISPEDLKFLPINGLEKLLKKNEELENYEACNAIQEAIKDNKCTTNAVAITVSIAFDTDEE